MAVTVNMPQPGPCSPWATIADVRAFCGDLDADDALITANLTAATEVLFEKSARQFTGTCTETLRPVSLNQLDMFPADWWRAWGYYWDDPWGYGSGAGAPFPFLPTLVGGSWVDIGLFTNRAVVWAAGERLDLFDTGAYPVTSASVKIDGVALSDAAFTIRDHRYLLRTDGNAWPTSQALIADDTQPGTWSATLSFGAIPPHMGKMACAELACQLTKYTIGDKCQLPLNVTQVSRNGVFYRMADVTRLLDAGRTGLYWCDLYVSTFNPHNMVRPPRVLSPDRAPIVSRFGRT